MSNLNWDDYFCNLVLLASKKSKDPSTQNGCVIVGKGHEIISTGFNGLPRGVHEDIPKMPENLERYDIGYLSNLDKMIKKMSARYERPEKYKWFEHAERNAIYNAARIGTSLMGSTLYVTAWPCCDCARGIIQSGIETVKIFDISTPEFKQRWKEDIDRTQIMFEEARIKVGIIDPKSIKLLVNE